MVFSFSAPLISEAQEKQEYEAFTEDERKAIQDDIYGTEDSFLKMNDERMTAKALEMFHEALDEIPDNQKREYLEARERSPQVLERECKPLDFLRVENCDPWAASRRFVRYWKTRKQIFGPDRAFLPMSLDGAMQEDLLVYQLGHIVLLPPDAHGRPVYFWNRVKTTKAVAHDDVFARIAFYTMHLLSQSPGCKEKGVIGIHNMRGFDLYNTFNRILTKKVIACSEAVPLVFKAFHLVTNKSGKAVVDIVLPVLKHISGKHMRHRIVVHAGADTEILRLLKPYGLSVSGLSAEVGGSFALRNFRQWLEMQQDRERSP